MLPPYNTTSAPPLSAYCNMVGCKNEGLMESDSLFFGTYYCDECREKILKRIELLLKFN